VSYILLYSAILLVYPDYTRAINDSSSSTADTSLKIKAYHKRALALFELANYEQAIQDATYIVAQLDTNHIAARAIIGRCLKMIGELKKAEEQITNVITMENDNPIHFLERGDIRFRAADRNKCVEAIHGKCRGCVSVAIE
jgi:tetratricopeptide (TPR) repeat protein